MGAEKGGEMASDAPKTPSAYKKITEKHQKRLESVISSLDSYTGKRGEMGQAIANDVLRKPFAHNEGNAIFNKEDLAAYEENTKQIADIMIAYLNTLVGEGSGKLDATALAKMVQEISSIQVGVMATLLMHPDKADLQGVLAWVTGAPQVDKKGGGRASDDAVFVNKAKAAISKYLNANNTSSDSSRFCWLILSFVNDKHKKPIFEHFIANNLKNNPQQAKKFLKESVKRGALTPSMMVKLMQKYEKGYKFNQAQGEDQVMAAAYKASKDFSERGKVYLESSTGSSRHIDNWFTLKSGLLAYAQVAAGVSFATTTIVGLTHEGAWKDPGRAVGAVVNAQNAFAGAVFGVAHKIREKKPIIEGLTPSDTATTQVRKSTSSGFNLALEANPEWRKFLTADSYFGAKVFAQYSAAMYKAFKGDEDTLRRAFTLKEFKRWLVANDKQSVVATIDKTFPKDKEGSSDAILNIAKAFRVFSIGGEKTSTEISFKCALKNTNASKVIPKATT